MLLYSKIEEDTLLKYRIVYVKDQETFSRASVIILTPHLRGINIITWSRNGTRRLPLSSGLSYRTLKSPIISISYLVNIHKVVYFDRKNQHVSSLPTRPEIGKCFLWFPSPFPTWNPQILAHLNIGLFAAACRTTLTVTRHSKSGEPRRGGATEFRLLAWRRPVIVHVLWTFASGGT